MRLPSYDGAARLAPTHLLMSGCAAGAGRSCVFSTAKIGFYFRTDKLNNEITSSASERKLDNKWVISKGGKCLGYLSVLAQSVLHECHLYMFVARGKL